jgi:hypothetical protein
MRFATHPGSNGKLVFDRPTKDGADLFSGAADGSGLHRGRCELVARWQQDRCRLR